MTLKEAIESGLPFRHTANGDWYVLPGNHTWSTAAVLSTYWEVKEEPREWEIRYWDDGRVTLWDPAPGAINYMLASGNLKALRTVKVREVME